MRTLRTPRGFWLAALMGCLNLAAHADEWVVTPKGAPAAVADAAIPPAADGGQGGSGFEGGNGFFPAARGLYNGLLAPEGDLVPERSGYFRLNLSSHGYFSGYFEVGDGRVPLRGWFNSQGLAGVSIYRRVWDDCHCFTELVLAWTVELNLVADSDELEGTLVNERRGGWETQLYGLKAGYSSGGISAPQTGRYTLRLPGAVDPAAAPPGDGYGAVTVNARGQVILSGALPDSTPMVDSAYLSADGYWPLFVPLSDGHGLLFGWARFDGNEVTGSLEWHKPPREDRAFYPAGFAGTINARGGRYGVSRSALSPFSWTQGQLRFSDGNVSGIRATDITFLSPTTVSVGAGDLPGTKLRVNSRTGVFTGTFLHPVSGRKTPYAGAVFQFEDAGGGYFLGTSQGGIVALIESAGAANP